MLTNKLAVNSFNLNKHYGWNGAPINIRRYTDTDATKIIKSEKRACRSFLISHLYTF